MARQAPTYAAHIAQIRQQAVEETAAERGRLQGQLSRVQAEMKRLQSCNDADRQTTQDLMEVEKIQVYGWLWLHFDCYYERYHAVADVYMLSRVGSKRHLQLAPFISRLVCSVCMLRMRCFAARF